MATELGDPSIDSGLLGGNGRGLSGQNSGMTEVRCSRNMVIVEAVVRNQVRRCVIIILLVVN